MAKIDLITLSGLTASDGSIIASGATIKFDSEFRASSTDIIIRPKLYRNRELFEGGYEPVICIGLPFDFIITVPEEEFYQITPTILYEKVRDALNMEVGSYLFEIEITGV